MNYTNAEFVSSFGTAYQLPPSEQPEIVFAGRSNVGKSSAINKIFNRKGLARVSGEPGKTATINFFRCGDIQFVDLPGYGYAKVSHSEKLRWAKLIEGYFAQDRDIRVVFSLIDVRHKPSKDDMMMLDFLIENEFPFVIILTKCDKLGVNALKARLIELKTEIPYGEQVTMIPFSSETGLGVDDVKSIINDIELEAETEEAEACNGGELDE